MNCPLCQTEKPEPFLSDRGRDWLRCPQCDLIFVSPNQRLSFEEEKARYDFHQNDPADPGYRKFLNRLFQPLEKKLSPGACGIDYGCGPGPTLSLLFCETGYDCKNFDPVYANDPARLEMQYDFLTCSETFEHMHRPREEFERFLKLVKPGGWIGIMTQLHDDAGLPFEEWFYKDDPTHVCIFSRRSFQWLSAACSRKRVTREKQYGLHVEFHPNGVVLFQCPEKKPA